MALTEALPGAEALPTTARPTVARLGFSVFAVAVTEALPTVARLDVGSP